MRRFRTLFGGGEQGRHTAPEADRSHGLVTSTWPSRGGGTRHEKLAFSPVKSLLVTQDKANNALHVFDTAGTDIRTILLAELFDEIKQQQASYLAGRATFGYQTECFALAEDAIYAGGRHPRLYATDWEGRVKGQVALPSDCWQQDIAVTSVYIYLLYQSAGIMVLSRDGALHHQVQSLGVHYCRRLAVNSQGEAFVAGTSEDAPAWADCIRKLSADGTPQESLTSFTNVGGLTVDPTDNIYVIEMNDGTLVKLDPDLKELARTKLGYEENGETKDLSYAQAIALDGQGCLYVLEGGSIVKSRLPF